MLTLPCEFSAVIWLQTSLWLWGHCPANCPAHTNPALSKEECLSALRFRAGERGGLGSGGVSPTSGVSSSCVRGCGPGTSSNLSSQHLVSFLCWLGSRWLLIKSRKDLKFPVCGTESPMTSPTALLPGALTPATDKDRTWASSSLRPKGKLAAQPTSSPDHSETQSPRADTPSHWRSGSFLWWAVSFLLCYLSFYEDHFDT